MRRLLIRTVPWLGVCIAIGFAAPAGAVDGVIEINQVKALAGGVVPGDPPGFPVAIVNTTGSFRLTSDLVITDPDMTAILVSTFEAGPVDVTIDLNGFSIRGVIECERVDNETQCSGSGNGYGINVGSFGVSLAVRNGTIRGMGSDGIGATFSTTRTRIDDVTAVSNAGSGFAVLLTQLTDSRAELNGDDGATVLEDGGLITGCVLRDNGNLGITSTAGNGIGGNSFLGNTAGAFVGGVVVAPNVCGAAVCP